MNSNAKIMPTVCRKFITYKYERLTGNTDFAETTVRLDNNGVGIAGRGI
jgi:hypothetical protein